MVGAARSGGSSPWSQEVVHFERPQQPWADELPGDSPTSIDFDSAPASTSQGDSGMTSLGRPAMAHPAASGAAGAKHSPANHAQNLAQRPLWRDDIDELLHVDVRQSPTLMELLDQVHAQGWTIRVSKLAAIGWTVSDADKEVRIDPAWIRSNAHGHELFFSVLELLVPLVSRTTCVNGGLDGCTAALTRAVGQTMELIFQVSHELDLFDEMATFFFGAPSDALRQLQREHLTHSDAQRDKHAFEYLALKMWGTGVEANGSTALRTAWGELLSQRGWNYHPPLMTPVMEKAFAPIIEGSPLLKEALGRLEADGWVIRHGRAGLGTYTDIENKRIVIDTDDFDPEHELPKSLERQLISDDALSLQSAAAAALAHEVGHAISKLHPELYADMLCVTEGLDEEGNANVFVFRVAKELGRPWSGLMLGNLFGASMFDAATIGLEYTRGHRSLEQTRRDLGELWRYALQSTTHMTYQDGLISDCAASNRQRPNPPAKPAWRLPSLTEIWHLMTHPPTVVSK